VLTNRIGGLAQQAGAFEFLCFIDNHDTDTQVWALWVRACVRARLLVKSGKEDSKCVKLSPKPYVIACF